MDPADRLQACPAGGGHRRAETVGQSQGQAGSAEGDHRDRRHHASSARSRGRTGRSRTPAETPLVGGQWLAKDGGKFDLVVCENTFRAGDPGAGAVQVPDLTGSTGWRVGGRRHIPSAIDDIGTDQDAGGLFEMRPHLGAGALGVARDGRIGDAPCARRAGRGPPGRAAPTPGGSARTAMNRMPRSRSSHGLSQAATSASWKRWWVSAQSSLTRAGRPGP